MIDQSQVKIPAIYKPFVVSGIAALSALLLSAIYLFKGIDLNPDGWAFWEGSVSLLQGHGYAYFGGQPITAWPPLFSLYLAVIQSVFGISGWSLSFAIVLIAGCSAGAWAYLFMIISKKNQRLGWTRYLFVLFLALYISLSYTALLSDTLFLFMLAVTFIIFIHVYINEEKGTFSYRLIFILGISNTALLLCRNSAMAFLPGIFLVNLYIFRKYAWMKKIVLFLLTLLMPLLFWYLITPALAPVSSHALTYHGKYAPYEYLWQFIIGLAALFGPGTRTFGFVLLYFAVMTLLLLVILRTGWGENVHLQILILLAVMVMTAIAGLFIIFNIIWIYEPFNGRFLWFLPIFVIGILYVMLSWETMDKMRYIGITVMFLVTFMQVHAAIPEMARRIRPEYQPVVCQRCTIDSYYFSSFSVDKEGQTLLSPPNYDWINRSYKQ